MFLPNFFTNYVLLFILLCEGFIILAYEFVTLRLVIPMAGSGVQSASLVICAVLLPLAFGYYRGGKFTIRSGSHQPKIKAKFTLKKIIFFFKLYAGLHTIRCKLIFNFAISSIFMAIGGSLILTESLFYTLGGWGIHHPFLQLTIYGIIFISIPVYFLGQTLPLISQIYYPRNSLNISRKTGLILCISTIGSLAGALVTSLIIMPIWGVHQAALFINAILLVMVMMIMPKRAYQLSLDFSRYFALPTMAMVGLAFLIAYIINSPQIFHAAGILANNQYHKIQVLEYPAAAPQNGVERHFMLNGGAASTYIPETGRVSGYVQYVEQNFIKARSLPGSAPHPGQMPSETLDILVIGGGGFTLGLYDQKNTYLFIDIDPDLKDIAQESFLKQPLSANKSFIAMPARRFLRSDKNQYDLIFLDTYNGLDLPMHLITHEFFTSIRNRLKPGGVLAANFILSPIFADQFSRNVDATFQSVFWPYSRQVINPIAPQSWHSPNHVQNIIYSYIHPTMPDQPAPRLITDLIHGYGQKRK